MLRVAVSFLVVLATASVYADQAAFNNGDRLSGEILLYYVDCDSINFPILYSKNDVFIFVHETP